jgi:hypothetical protein
MIGFTGELGNSFMPGSGHHTLGGLIAIRKARHLRTVCHGNLRPELFGTFPTTIPDVTRNSLARLGIHGHPEPLLVGLLSHQAAHVIGFRLQLLHDPIARTSEELDMQVIGSCLEAGHEDTLLLSNDALLSVQDKLSAPGLALMVLLAGMNMPVPLDLYSATPWARLSPDHSLLLPSLYKYRLLASSSMELCGEHYLEHTTDIAA